jgi:hypothetical protein
MTCIKTIARLALTAFLSLSSLACSDDDKSDGGYAGVTHWKCFQFGDSDCECAGLGPNDDFEAGGNDVTQVDSCPAELSVCQSWADEDGDFTCECRAAAWTPNGTVSSLTSTTQCPPG